MNNYKPGEPCPRNDGILCQDHSKCSRCGWNPKVSEKRLKEIQEKQKTEGC